MFAFNNFVFAFVNRHAHSMGNLVSPKAQSPNVSAIPPAPTRVSSRRKAHSKALATMKTISKLKQIEQEEVMKQTSKQNLFMAKS